MIEPLGAAAPAFTVAAFANDETHSIPTVTYPDYSSFKQLLNRHQPDMPIHGLRPAVLRATATYFLQNFPGTAMYAVKCNPDPLVIRTLAEAGLKHFDVASIPEIEAVRQHAPGAELFYMHPVKSRLSIRRAYFDYGVRHFSLDCMAELTKILEETQQAADLHLHVRLALPKGEAFHALSEKFGVAENDAIDLLQAVSKVAKIGLCFHVGSQTMTPAPYSKALERVGQLIATSGVKLDSLDVGGGFPVAYPGLAPAPMDEFMRTLRQDIAALKLPSTCQIFGEPGRALVAEAGSLLVRVDLRKDSNGTSALYINDGVYGSLFDSGMFGLIHPVKLHRMRAPSQAPVSLASRKLQDFIFYGPTCDSVDTIKGPYRLPADVQEGDYLEFGQTGAYTFALQSKFNGFYSEEVVTLADQPQMTLPGYWAS